MTTKYNERKLTKLASLLSVSALMLMAVVWPGHKAGYGGCRMLLLD